MSITSIVILLFVFIESLNVLTLYFNPGSDKGNGIGVFDAWERSKADPEMHQFVRYLVYWVAGTKLIFIVLLLIIALTADAFTQQLTVIAMIASIATFYWRLYPIIKQLDKERHISPRGYSKTLGIMIAVMIAVFMLDLIASVII